MQSAADPSPAPFVLRAKPNLRGHNFQSPNINGEKFHRTAEFQGSGYLQYEWKTACTALPTWEPRYSLVHSRRFTSRDVSKKYRQRKKKMMPRGITSIAIQRIEPTITPTTPITSRNIWNSENRYRGLLMKDTFQRQTLMSSFVRMLQFMGSQRVGHDWATELNWTELKLLSLKDLLKQ